ncbi:MAG: sulfatase [Prolixibacteraceae bacterium]|jgi:arylsulfatase A-like enzyme|nr:sulfatase [Prolixibacteraceae bacterium]
MNQKLIVSTAAVAFLGAATTQCRQKEAKPMNVVFFLVDDLGWTDVSCYGSSFYETPNINRFAEEGVRFTSAYAACHVCSPSRASILSGKYPASINLTDWLPGRLDFPFQKLKNVSVNQHLPYDGTTIPKVLQENGYKTAIFGKWHLGEDSASTARQGFDLHVPEGWNKGWPNKGYFSPYGLKGLEDGPAGEYLTDRLTTEALKYIEENKNQPFFLYLSHFAVHDPIEGRPDLVEKYKKKLAQIPAPEGPPFVMEGNPDAPAGKKTGQPYEGYRIFPDQTVQIKQRQDNVEFAAMVESMDESLGRVLDKLKTLDIDDHTIVIFYSDNGGMAAANFYEPERVIQENELDKAFSTSNLPLRGAKGWLYEGGIRVPLIVKWPGKGLQGAVCDVPVTSPDFLPTIVEMLGIPAQSGVQSDGISFAPLLKGEAEINREAIFWHFPHYSNHGMQSPGGAVRCGDYKLLEYYENNTVQLFNLKSDIEERHDLSSSMPEKVKELKEMMHNWRKQAGAKMMEPNPDYKAIQ